MILLKLILFMLIFTLDVHVRAEQSNLLQDPDHCYGKEDICTIQVQSTKSKLDLPLSQVVATLGTIVETHKSEIRFISGAIWFLNSQQVTIKTEYGSIVGEGDFYLQKDASRIVIRVHEGKVKILSKGSSEEVFVLPGFENFISGVDHTGHAQLGFPQVLPLKEHMKTLSRLSPYTKVELVEKFKKLSAQCKVAAEQLSKIHAEISGHLNSHEKEKRRRLASENEKKQIENTRLKNMFRKKNDFDLE